MWKLTTYLMFSFVPVFIVLIVNAMKDLIDYKTGFSFQEKEMEIPFPSLTICPFDYVNTLPHETAFRALNYGNGSELPIKMITYLLPNAMHDEHMKIRYSFFILNSQIINMMNVTLTPKFE